MAYSPENNPYIPGDPYSYDLAWMVEKIKGWKDPADSAERAKASEEAAAASAEAADLSAQAAEGSAGDAADSAQEAKNYADNIADPVSGLVTEWLEDNITQPTTPAIDRSLTVMDAAADAKFTGIAAKIGQYIASGVDENFIDLSGVTFTDGSYISDVTTGTIGSNANMTLSDYIAIPENVRQVIVNRVIYNASGASFAQSNMVCCYDKDLNVISRDARTNTDSLSIITLNPRCKYVRINFDLNYVPHFVYAPLAAERTLTSSLGLVGEYHGSFTSAQQVVYTKIYAQPRSTYIIRFYSERTERLNIFCRNASTHFVTLQPFENQIIFTNQEDDTRELGVYNIDGALMNIDLKVFTPASIISKAEEVPRVYRVTKMALTSSDYHSLTQCLLDLKDDESPKIIEIYGGDYDIWQEYQDAGVPVYTGNDPAYDYFDYCVWVPKNTHIIGKGIVKLNWLPDPGDVTVPQSKTVSPLNCAGNCIIENIEVYCKNGRYCLHNDALGKAQYNGARQIYKNVTFVKYGNDTDPDSGIRYGSTQAVGFGIDAMMHHVYENCTFINEDSARAFYGHVRSSSPANAYGSPDITMNNCVFLSGAEYCVRFGNSSTNAKNIRIRTLFNNCYFQSGVQSALEGGSGNCANVFDMQFNGCGSVTVKIDDPANPYVPRAYNTIMTLL